MIPAMLRNPIGSLVCIVIVLVVSTTFLSLIRERLGYGLPSSSVRQPYQNQVSGVAAPAQENSEYAMLSSDVQKQQLEALSQLNQAAEDAAVALKCCKDWASEIDPIREHSLIDSPRGADTTSDKLYTLLAEEFGQDRLGMEQIAQTSARIELLRKEVETASEQARPSQLPLSKIAEIGRLKSTSSTAKLEWTAAIKNARSLVHSIKRRSSQSLLESAVPSTVEERMKDEEAKRLVAQLERQKEEEAAARTAQTALDAERRLADEEFYQESQSTEVQAALAPFTSARHVQPAGMAGVTLRFRKTPEQQPMSLASIAALGALEESELGLERLATIAGHHELDGPKWSINRNSKYWSDDQFEMVSRAQQALKTYGRLLVERGQLSN